MCVCAVDWIISRDQNWVYKMASALHSAPLHALLMFSFFLYFVLVCNAVVLREKRKERSIEMKFYGQWWRRRRLRPGEGEELLLLTYWKGIICWKHGTHILIIVFSFLFSVIKWNAFIAWRLAREYYRAAQGAAAAGSWREERQGVKQQRRTLDANPHSTPKLFRAVDGMTSALRCFYCENYRQSPLLPPSLPWRLTTPCLVAIRQCHFHWSLGEESTRYLSLPANPDVICYYCKQYLNDKSTQRTTKLALALRLMMTMTHQSSMIIEARTRNSECNKLVVKIDLQKRTARWADFLMSLSSISSVTSSIISDESCSMSHASTCSSLAKSPW